MTDATPTGREEVYLMEVGGSLLRIRLTATTLLLYESVPPDRWQLLHSRTRFGADEVERLRAAARLGAWALKESRESWSDLDGGALQDKAVELGVMVEVTVTEPCDPEFCQCAEYGDFPQTCIRDREGE